MNKRRCKNGGFFGGNWGAKGSSPYSRDYKEDLHIPTNLIGVLDVEAPAKAVLNQLDFFSSREARSFLDRD